MRTGFSTPNTSAFPASKLTSRPSTERQRANTMPITTMPDGARSHQLASVNMEYFVSVLFVNTSCSDFNAVKDFKASVQATQINGENAQSAIANNPSRDDSLSTIENAVSNQATICVTDYLFISLDPSIERHGRFEQQSYFVHHNHRWR